MKTIRRLLPLLLLFAVLAAAADRPLFLWKAEKGKTTAWLFGTMHLADPQLQELPWGVKRIITRCRGGVYTEVPMTRETQMKSARLMRRDDGKPLREILPASVYNEMHRYLERLDPRLTPERYDGLKLWAVATTLSSLPNQLKYPLLPPVDTVVYRYARAKGRPVAGIETVEEQIGALDAFTRNEQLLMLEGTLETLLGEKNYDETMKRLYLKGDEAALLSFIRRTMFNVPRYRALERKFMRVLLYDRNERMAERVDALLKAHPGECRFFAFGVMHFLGDGSVVELLRRKGYRVTRVPYPKQ